MSDEAVTPRDVDVGLGPIHDRFPDVCRIAVLRGGGLGDVLFALPAIQSLADAYPLAEVTLLGAPLGIELLSGRPGPVDRFWRLPAARGVHEPVGERGARPTLTDFVARARARRFDLAVQLHGGGRWSNPFLSSLHPRHTVGGQTQDAAELERTIPFPYYNHEVLRALEIAGLAGARPTTLRSEIPVLPADLAAADAALAGLPPNPLVIHPSATDPRRIWPADRFVTVGAEVASRGIGIVVIGTAAEAGLAEHVGAGIRDCSRRRAAVRVLAGTIDLSGLVGVLARARLLLANDSGPRHVAQAIGCPTVSIFLAANVLNAGPLGRAEHGVHIAWTIQCPLCGTDCVDPYVPRCGHDVSYVANVPAEPVVEDVLARCGVESRP